MKLVISGNVPSQKNNKVIAYNRRSNKPFIRSNARVKDWQRRAVAELIDQFDGYVTSGYPIDLSFTFYYQDRRRRDLDNSVSSVLDVMVKAEVIEDDSVDFINKIEAIFGGVDKANPRVEIGMRD